MSLDSGRSKALSLLERLVELPYTAEKLSIVSISRYPKSEIFSAEMVLQHFIPDQENPRSIIIDKIPYDLGLEKAALSFNGNLFYLVGKRKTGKEIRLIERLLEKT